MELKLLTTFIVIGRQFPPSWLHFSHRPHDWSSCSRYIELTVALMVCQLLTWSTCNNSIFGPNSFSYPEPILRAVNGARQGALAKSISNWHLIGHNEGCCSNTGYMLLPCFYGIRLWIWPEPLVAPRVRRALGTRMEVIIPCPVYTNIERDSFLQGYIASHNII
jgi:hypothetical protein